MKKLFTVLAAALMISASASAQHEIGAVVGGMNGVSYKYWFNKNLALQADLAFGLTKGVGSIYSEGVNLTPGILASINKNYSDKKTLSAGLWDFTINPNLLYHLELPSNFKLYAGCGIGFGMMELRNVTIDRVTWTMLGTFSQLMGKFGINAAVGVSYDVKSVPLVLAFDFRPGYGLGFGGKYETGPKSVVDYHISYFDWKLAFAVRYKL